jgi:uncharacterized FlaG/YvyC family protein
VKNSDSEQSESDNDSQSGTIQEAMNDSMDSLQDYDNNNIEFKILETDEPKNAVYVNVKENYFTMMEL